MSDLAPNTELFEVFVETEPTEHVVDGGDRPEPWCSFAGEFVGLKPGAVGVVL